MINFIYFVTTIGSVLVFRHPVLVVIAYFSSFAYSTKLNGIKGMVFDICLIPFIFVFAWYYSFYHHFGVTNLRENFVGNMITLESIVYGFVLGVVIVTVIMMCSCLLAVVSSDKVVYLFGKISPRLALFLSIILRAVPRIKTTAKKIKVSQRGIGRKGIFNLPRLVSIVTTWTLDDFAESSNSMKARGYLLGGRTSFSIYRFDNRDRLFVVAIFLCLTIIAAGLALNQATMYYDPMIIMNKVTPLSFVFYGAYAFLFLLPMLLQIIGEIRFECLCDKIQG